LNAKRAAAAQRDYDVVLYGATGFVGRQTVAYFAQHAGALRWALAGRTAAKLEQVRAACGPGAAGAGIVVADAADAKALSALAAQARVVLSTAGPFALHGSALVAACVQQRCHYVDITGETPWVRDLIDRHHDQAARDGTRIIPCCGFDSVPSDLGAWLVAQAVWQQHGEACVSVKACHSMRGGVNGGTLASALNMMESGQRRRFAEPFLLNPVLNPPGSGPEDAAAHADPIAPQYDADFDAWLGPFVMGPINTRVVRRSAALLAARGDAPAYAAGFRYQEYLRYGKGPLAAAAAGGVTLGLGLGMVAMRFKPWRAVAEALMPAPGSGPSQASMDSGSFRCELIGTSVGGHNVRGRVAGRGDPGNRATTVFVCEAALALANEPAAQLPGGAGAGGVLTPASGLGQALAHRLVAAGMTLQPLRA
jgi:short subunit dehydrogenase-like uncharacterized protein